MKTTKVLAIHPKSPLIADFAAMPPLGMLWVAGSARQQGCDVMFIDEQVDGSADPVRVADNSLPDLVLLGGTSHSRFRAFHLAQQIKRVSPSSLVVYGGPHASFAAADTLQNLKAIDIIAHGEGELTCRDLVKWSAAGRRDQLQNIAGITFRHETDGILHTTRRPPIHDLDALGPPPRDMIEMRQYSMSLEFHPECKATSVITARGCPIECTFCSASVMFGRSYRMRSPHLVVDEIEGLLREHACQGIKIFDSTFTLSRRHVRTFCQELRRRQIRILWECEIRADTVDERILAEMREAGCYYIDVGVESGSQRVLDQCVRKRITLDQVEHVLAWAQQLGMRTKAFFTIGHPGETFAEASETHRFIRRHRRAIHNVGYRAGINVYPGTEVERFAREHNLLPEDFRWSSPFSDKRLAALFKSEEPVPILLQPQLGITELARLRKQYILMRLAEPRFFWNKVKWMWQRRLITRYIGLLMAGAIGARRAKKVQV